MADTAALVGSLCARTFRAGCISSFSSRTKPGQVDAFIVRIMVAKSKLACEVDRQQQVHPE